MIYLYLPLFFMVAMVGLAAVVLAANWGSVTVSQTAHFVDSGWLLKALRSQRSFDAVVMKRRSRAIFVVLLLALGAAMFLFSNQSWAQMTDDDDLDVAALIFGPGPSPWLTAANAIQAGHEIPGPALAGIKPDIDRRFQTGRFTLLQFAWRKQNLDAMGQLLAAGADPKAPGPLGQEGDDLIFQVLTCQKEPLGVNALNVLLAHGLDPNFRDSPDTTPILQYAVSARDLELAKRLLAVGANPWIAGGGSLAPYSTVQNAADDLNLPFLDYLAQSGGFDGKSVQDIQPILESLAQIRQNGDDISRAIQVTARLIIAKTHYPPDASTNYLLGGK